ncbi:MAG: DUF6110 family protein [Clostridiales bacterium]|nr:DUF6110 family protein [Clostridiales bacterium]
MTSGIIKAGLFLGGVLFGTAGIKLLSSKDAKKAYVHCTAAALRAKDSVMKTATEIQENAEDVLAEAKQINSDRALSEAEAVVEDEAEISSSSYEEKPEEA